MNIITVGIDLAKNEFDLHGVDPSGKAVFIKPTVVNCWKWSPTCRLLSLINPDFLVRGSNAAKAKDLGGLHRVLSPSS